MEFDSSGVLVWVGDEKVLVLLRGFKHRRFRVTDGNREATVIVLIFLASFHLLGLFFGICNMTSHTKSR